MTLQTEAEFIAEVMEAKWRDMRAAKTGIFSSTVDLSLAAKFLISSLDEAIKYAESKLSENLSGPKKKEFVMTVIARIYDTTIAANLPMWMFPFVSTLKDFVINKLISNLIDYVVLKYNSGTWGVFVPSEPVPPRVIHEVVHTIAPMMR